MTISSKLCRVWEPKLSRAPASPGRDHFAFDNFLHIFDQVVATEAIKILSVKIVEKPRGVAKILKILQKLFYVINKFNQN